MDPIVSQQHSHRSTIVSRSQRSAKKSSLKRSKSLHCPKSAFNGTAPEYNGYAFQGQYQLSNGALKGPRQVDVQYYGNRRHHSTNDYNGDWENAPSPYGLVLNSSSHNLYNQYNSPTVPPPSKGRISSGSGTSLLSLTEAQPGSQSRKPSDYFEDVFYDGSSHSNGHSNGYQHPHAQLCTQMGSLSLESHNKGTIANSNHSRRYNGSSSNSSLFNGQDVGGLPMDAYDYERTMFDLDNDNVWDDFTLEPLPESKPDRLNQTSTKKSSPSSPYRFYLIRQRNYPPLYLENMSNRRRIYRILVLGYPSAGKTSLIEQFSNLLSESERARFNPSLASELNERTNLLIHFLETDSFDKYLLQMPITDYQPDSYLILYSVNNRDSFNRVKSTLVDLQRWDDVETKSIIIVANKSDLVRGRCVTRREGRDLASANNCKYIETSCTISHNIDVLLQGLGSQICLKEEQQRKQKELEHSKFNGAPKIKRRDSLLKRFLRKTAINKSKSCDNLHVL